MPNGNEIPIGLDQHDVLPCGCRWSYALVELWVVGVGLWDQRQNNGKIAVSFFYSSFEMNSADISRNSPPRSARSFTTW